MFMMGPQLDDGRFRIIDHVRELDIVGIHRGVPATTFQSLAKGKNLKR